LIDPYDAHADFDATNLGGIRRDTVHLRIAQIVSPWIGWEAMSLGKLNAVAVGPVLVRVARRARGDQGVVQQLLLPRRIPIVHQCGIELRLVVVAIPVRSRGGGP